MKKVLVCLSLLLLILAACQVGPGPGDSTGNRATPAVDAPVPGSPIELPNGYQAEVVATGLRGPTQMIMGPDGRLWIAQLNGGENAGTGQIVALDLSTGFQEVLLDGLTKPTGLVVTDDTLWIVAGADILRAPLIDGRPGAAEIVLADLPTNGRSNGTLTLMPDGRLVYETSGRRQGDGVLPGSGQLWALDPADPAAPVSIAHGLKGAYAHTVDAAGQLWTTEIGDDPVETGAPPDEINLVVPGADYGWPGCYGLGEPSARYGGTAETCAATVRPVALLPPRSTPTSIVESPWEPGVLLVALWLTGEVVRIDPDAGGGSAAVQAWASGLDQPQHLLVTPEGDLLISDHGRGTVCRITQP